MSNRLTTRSLGLPLIAVIFLFSLASRAQVNTGETKGVDSGNYNIQQTVEAGYRGNWIDGNQETYGTFVNLGRGLRLFDYTVTMRSINHQGILFDNLNFSNFGYGGDPDNVSRLRIEKNKWFDFSGVFRRHKNFWNYNLLANPLNPVPLPPNANPVTNPSFAVTNSPHALYRVRRMQDYNLTLRPQSAVRFRLGYSRLVDEGPSFTSFHGTTDFLLVQNFRMTTNAYRIGVDFRLLPKTTISYDQILEYNKQDTIDTLAGLPFLIFPGVPVDMGLNWYYPPTAGTTPCATPFLATGFANTACKGYRSYLRVAPARNFMPTERLSFQSTYLRNLEMSGAVSYNHANNNLTGLNDDANEWTNPANVNTSGQIRDAIVRGTGFAKQVFVHANWSGIYSLTQKIRILDSVRFDTWRNPGYFDQLATNSFATPPVAGETGILLPIAKFSIPGSGTGLTTTFASICPGPTYSAATCPQHGTTAAADFQRTLNATFLGQRILSNTIQLEVDFTRRFIGRIGYSYENRKISDSGSSDVVQAIFYPGGPSSVSNAGNDFLAARGLCALVLGVLPAGCSPPNADGSITYNKAPLQSGALASNTINEHVALLGATLRPMNTLNIYADFQFGFSDYSYTRVWPRQVKSYKVHASYRPRLWASIDGAIDIQENRDNVAQVNNLEHGRTYSFSAVLAPNSKVSFTLGYNYTDLHLQTYICFRDTFGTIAGLPTFAACAFNGGNATVTLGATSFYSNQQHFAYSDVMWKPVKRVAAIVGYAGTFAGGSTLFLNPLQPGGTLAFNYQKPYASIEIDLYKGLSYKTSWNYYGYNSKTPINTSVPITGGTYALQPIGGPDFNGSTATFAFRYAF